MANITRIKAKDPNKPTEKPEKLEKSEKLDKTEKLDKKPAASKAPSLKDSEKALAKKERKSGKKPFILFRPFVAFGRYLKNSWAELRQVRWPNRKVTWKMVLAIFIYTLIFSGILVLLDILFDWLFSIILK